MNDPSLDSGPLGRLAEEFLDRRKRGERPTVEEFAAEYPELAEQIRAFFPALLVVEDLKPGPQDLTDSFPGVGRSGFGPTPERLGDYRVIREVGRGGMGVVYEAEQESLGRRVALKVLAGQSLLDPKRLSRFHREAKAAARLHHTNIVPVFGVGESDGVHYYVMQFIAGAGLDEVIDEVRHLQAGNPGEAATGLDGAGAGARARSADLSMAAAVALMDGRAPEPAALEESGAMEGPPRAAALSSASLGSSVLSAATETGRCYARSVAHVGVQLAEALAYAHEQGILHRDIKPANILLDAHGIAWITDFGLAKAAADDDLTHSGDIVGTIRYMAPERFHGRCDARSDLYALGLTLYELLARRPAFDGADRNTLIRQVSQVEPTGLRHIDPAIPRDLETIVHKSIEKDPTHRYATAAELAEDLRCVLQDRPIRARRATQLERVWRWSRRNPATAGLAALAAASLVMAAIVGWAGYVSTKRALAGESSRRSEAEAATRRAEENVALSLEVFEELFQRLAPRDTLPPPPLGLSVTQSPPGGGGPPGGPGGRGGPPGGRPGDFRGEPEGRFLPPDGSEGGPPPPGGRERGDPRGPGPREASAGETVLLRSILDFYDRFAAKNATNPKLQGEAAWAYRRVGALNERLGRAAEAEAAYARAIAILEELATRYPDQPEYRFKLVETFDIADPWSADPASLERLEQRLRRAQELTDRLAAESPENVDYAHARIHIYAKLGVAHQRLGRDDSAEAAYTRAIILEGELLERVPDDGRSRYDRATTREALAMLLAGRGRRDEARVLLDAAADELRALAADDRSRRPPAELFERLAAAFRELGEPERAVEMDRWAERVNPPRPPGFPGPPGRGPRPPGRGEAEGRNPDEGRPG